MSALLATARHASRRCSRERPTATPEPRGDGPAAAAGRTARRRRGPLRSPVAGWAAVLPIDIASWSSAVASAGRAASPIALSRGAAAAARSVTRLTRGRSTRHLRPHGTVRDRHPPSRREILLRAYSVGLFPMAEGADDPTPVLGRSRSSAASFPLDGLIVSRSLAKTVAVGPLRRSMSTATSTP